MGEVSRLDVNLGGPPDDHRWLAGGGETGALMRAHDWRGSPLGAPASWPQSLRSVVGLLLGSKFPMFVAWGPELGFLYNDAYAEILGAKHPAALGARFQDVWAEIWPDIWPLIDGAMAGEASWREDLPLRMNRRGYDEQTWFTFSYSPLRDESGAVAGMFCAVMETTARIRTERHLALVVNELNHRVKNNLAMTQAIASQTLRNSGDVRQAEAAFTARLKALAQANDLLTGERWVSVSMRGVIEQALEPHRVAAPERARVEGPEIELSPKTALSLSLAVHELATNATKYGAWRNDSGVVEVRWERIPDDVGARMRLEWRERGGPPVEPPARRGFGSRLIERGLAAEMGGTVTMSFRPDGLTCLVEAPLATTEI